MMRVNRKFFATLTATAVLLAAGLFIIHRLQSGRIAQALLWQARRAEEQGRPDEAARFLGRYLEFAPEDIEERAHLGRVLAGPGSPMKARQQALFVLEQVLSRAPERHDSRRLLVRLALDLGQYAAAEPHLQPLRQAFPTDGDVDRLVARWHEGQGHPAEAVACYRQAVAHAPHEVENYLHLADLLRHPPDPARQQAGAREADHVLNDLVARNGDAYQAYLGRWRSRRDAWGSLDEAAKRAAPLDVARALELAPKEPDVLVAAADLARAEDDLPRARRYLQDGIRLRPGDSRLYRSLALVELEAGRRDEAVARLREGVKTAGVRGRFELLWDLANLLIDGGELEPAGAVIAQVRQTDSSQASVDYLLARVRMAEGHWSEAAELLERARPHLEPVPALVKQVDLFLGECYEQLDEPKLQRAAYQRVLAQDPGCVAARLRLGAAQGASGELDAAIDQYRQALAQRNPPAGGWLEVTRLLIVRNLRRDPAERDWKEVDDALSRAARAQPDSVEVALLRAEALAGQNQPERAREELIRVRDRRPKVPELWAALAILAEREGKRDEAGRLLDEAERQAGDSITLRLARARYWAHEGGPRARSALAQLGARTNAFPSDDQVRLHRGLAEACRGVGDLTAALGHWDAVARTSRYRNDPRVRLLMFDLALEAGDAATLKRLLGELQRIENGQGTFWRFCEARRLTWQARRGDRKLLDTAGDLLNTVASRRPTWAAVPLARADIEQLRGHTDQAIAAFREAIELGERNPLVVRKLVRLLIERKRFAEAERETVRLQQQGAMAADLHRLAVSIALENDDPDRAVQLAREAVSAESRDYRDYLWLGQVLAAGGRPAAEVEEKLRRATELGADVPQTWVALVQYLAQAGRPADAAAAIEQARARLKDTQRSLALGPCYEALGKLDEARRQYEDALKRRPDDPVTLRAVAAFYLHTGKVADAEPLLRKIIERRVPAADPDVAAARHNLALALATAGDYRRFAEALTLVGLGFDPSGAIRESPPPVDDPTEEVRARARVLATQNGRTFRTRAIALFEELNDRQALVADDQFRLVQLYEAGGAWPKARNLLQSLVAAQGQNPVFLGRYIQTLLRDRQTDDAQRYLDRLARLEAERKVPPGTFGTIELRAQLLETRGEGEAAFRLLKDYAAQHDAEPQRILLVIACLARQGRLTEALDWCERAWQACPPEAAGGVSVTVLRMGLPSTADYDRVERRLRAALDRNPKSTELPVQLAGLLTARGRFEDAEAAYRHALEREPGNVLALNNLAWLLAQRSGKGTDALPLIERALEVAGPRADLLDTRALVYLSLGRSEPAVRDLQAALAEQPTADRYFHLARAQHLARNREAAAAAFRQAKAAGLKSQELHPSERVAFAQLADELEPR